MSVRATYIPLNELVKWPEHLFSNPGLESVALTGHKLVQTAGRVTAYLDLALANDLVITAVGCDGLEFVLPTTDLAIEAAYVGTFELRIGGFAALLRVRNSLIKPVAGSYPNWSLLLDADGNPQPIELALDVGQLTVDADLSPYFDITNEITLAPFMIGDSGIVVEVLGVRLFLSGKEIAPAGQPEGFRGIALDQVNVYLPTSFDLPGITPDAILVRGLVIGHGGVSGSISGAWQPQWEGMTPTGTGGGTLLGFPFALTSLGIAFVQNGFTSAVFVGAIGIPFLDAVVAVEVSLDVAGALSVSLTGTEDDQLITADTPIGVFTLSSVAVVSDEAGAGVLISGSFQLEVGSPALQWPEVVVQNLFIGADGAVKLPGGWLDLQTPLAIDLYGFRLEISRIGFGNLEDGRRKICFSGGLHLVDMLPAGVSVEGLCVIWDPTGVRGPEITLQGVGIELTIPGVLALDGDVALIQDGDQHFFKGNAKLEIMPIGVTLDASVKIGHDTVARYNFIYTFLSLELPIGIPLWASGAAIFGISGLYGMNVLPASDDGDWYAWYAGPPEAFSVTNSDKWSGAQDGRAFGAGMVLGTLFDAGRVVSAKALFALILPGPVILFNGKANVLQTPPKLSDSSSEATFDMLAVLDAQAGDMQLNIDAGWSLGKVIDIQANSESYFDFANPRNWHLYLGQDQPADRRIRASIVALFHADAYLMIDSHGIATGAGVTWGVDWKFGPVKVILRAWIEAHALIAWQPPQLVGSLALGGEFEISIAGFGVGLSAEASLTGEAPTLYWIRGELLLRVKLPVPIKDLEEDIVLEWKEAATPPSDDPFTCVGVEHLKVAETWMLDDFNEAGAPDHPLDPDDAAFVPGPIVPLDARPAIVFDRSMKDVTTDLDLLSVTVYPGGTTIGEHTFDYEVQAISLEKWSKAGGAAWERVEDLYGTWMAIEDGGGEPAASKLQLWAKSPFAFTRRSSRTYRDAFLAHHLDWPCAETPPPVRLCVDWEQEALDTRYGPVFEREGLMFVLESAATVVMQTITECGTRQGLRISDGTTAWIVFPEPVRHVELCLVGSLSVASAYANGVLVAQTAAWPDRVVLSWPGIDSLYLGHGDNVCLASVCYETEQATEVREATQEHIDRLVAGLTHWSSADEILEPEMWYRLTVQLATVRTYKGEKFQQPFSHYAYFQTVGPPGLIPAWISATAGEPSSTGAALAEAAYPAGGNLTDLSHYVQWSIPENGATPVYRAYDIGVEFNENYVEQMYGSDMIVRLLDINGLPIRDESGTEISFLNQWAAVPTVELSETELAYVTRVKDCVTLPGFSLPPDQKIMASSGVLLEEDFSGDLEQWTDAQAPDGDPNARWTVANGQLLFTGAVVAALGALLIAGDEAWQDYAVEVELSDQGDQVGLVFRYSHTEVESFYRLRLAANGRYLERVADGVVTLLWNDTAAFVPGDVKTLAVQCQGARLRGQLDAELLFDLHDQAGLGAGKVGLYTNATAAFERVLVRVWPGSVLAPQSKYSAQLLASFVLFQGGLQAGWIDAAFAWDELIRDNTRIATIGREDWDQYRLEVNVAAGNASVGALLRFIKRGDGTFSCYRLLLNPDGALIRLVRLEGTYSGSTYNVNPDGRQTLWSCTGSACGVDFEADEHSLALACEGQDLIVEVDGLVLARVQDPNPLLSGKAGLYYSGALPSGFSDLVIRSVPRQPVYQWSFSTSRYAGLVELMDTFAGQLYAEPVPHIDGATLTEIRRAVSADLQRVTNELESARQALENALPEEVLTCRAAAQQAAADLHAVVVGHFEALYQLFFGSVYRPAPPVVEISELVAGTRRYGLLFESPEPLNWSRLTTQLSMWQPAAQSFEPIQNVSLVWNDDGTKAFLSAAALPTGEYRLHFAYRLDLGAEAPLLRRSASTLPEVTALIFSCT